MPTRPCFRSSRSRPSCLWKALGANMSCLSLIFLILCCWLVGWLAGCFCVSLPCLALPCLALPCLALPCLALPCLLACLPLGWWVGWLVGWFACVLFHCLLACLLACNLGQFLSCFPRGAKPTMFKPPHFEAPSYCVMFGPRRYVLGEVGNVISSLF